MLETVSTRKTRLERKFDPHVIRGLKFQSPHDVAVGGLTLAAHAIHADLVDEYHLFVAPVILGGGKPILRGSIFAIALSGHDQGATAFRTGSPRIAALPRLTGAPYRCTRPDPPPFSSAFTSSTVNRLKSPGIECFKQLAATANSSASWCVFRFWKP